MDILNVTRYDVDLIIRYNKSYLQRYLQRNFLVTAVIVFAFSLYFILTGDPLRAVLVIAILLGYLGLTVLLQWLTLRNVLKRSPIVHQPLDQQYHFQEDAIFLDGKTRKVLPYDEIIKISMVGDFMVLYDKEKTPYIIDQTKYQHVDDRNAVKSHLIVKVGKKISE
jgi:hypothetical protein